MGFTRAEILQSLLELRMPLSRICALLQAVSWDSEAKLATLTPQHIVAVLSRFVAGEVSADDVEHWANLLECREDIAFPKMKDMEVADVILELANPLLFEPIAIGMAHRWIDKLSSATGSSRSGLA